METRCTKSIFKKKRLNKTDMKRNYLMTGMKYPCKGDVRLLKSTMEHLEKTMPEMLVVKTYNKYGAVLKVVEADD